MCVYCHYNINLTPACPAHLNAEAHDMIRYRTMYCTVVTRDNLTKQGLYGLSNHHGFLESILQNLENACFFLDREGFPVETGSLALLRNSKRIYVYDRIYIVHSYSHSRRLQSTIRKTLVLTPACQIAKNAQKWLSNL
jgi:hypothetical protein